MDQTEIDRVRADCAERVAGPGKFEGEESYVAHFYDASLEGCGSEVLDDDDTLVTFFRVSDEDLALFPALAGIFGVAIWERSDGFVCSRTFDDSAAFYAAQGV